MAEGSEVMRRFRVTGPETEPPFQINDSWIHPRGAAEVPEVASQAPGPGDWLYRLEMAGHGPLSWRETHRARMPTKAEADLLQIPVTLPVLEIVRVGTSAKDGKPIEVTMYVIPSDRVEQVVVLERDETRRMALARTGPLTRERPGRRRAERHGLGLADSVAALRHVDDDDADVVRPSGGLGQGDELAHGITGPGGRGQDLADRRVGHNRAQPVRAEQVPVAGPQLAAAEIRGPVRAPVEIPRQHRRQVSGVGDELAHHMIFGDLPHLTIPEPECARVADMNEPGLVS